VKFRFVVLLAALSVFAGCAVQPLRDDTRPPEPSTSVSAPAPTPQIVVPIPDIVTPTPSATPPVADPEPSQTPEIAPVDPEKVDCRKQKCVALTIDDGPSPYSEKVLTILKKKNVKATFFLMGKKVKLYPNAVKHMAEQGHLVQNHSYSHPEFWKMSADQITSQLKRTNKLIKAQTGKTPILFRPPYGETNATIRKVGKQLKMAQILWDVDPNDWRDQDTDLVVKRVLKKVKPGSIVLTHELYMTTLKAYPIIIDKLRAKGYVFVTVDQIIGAKPTPGKNYSQGVAPSSKKKSK
jgi:peptidoglycan/xylan/chitin deacetylase (PgdA/CDA1 family)